VVFSAIYGPTFICKIFLFPLYHVIFFGFFLSTGFFTCLLQHKVCAWLSIHGCEIDHVISFFTSSRGRQNLFLEASSIWKAPFCISAGNHFLWGVFFLIALAKSYELCYSQ
jgi:hypothetical protein